MFKVSNLFRMLFAAAMPAYAFDPKDPADMAAVQELIDAAVEPLTTKNKQLLAEKKKLQKVAEIDPADVERLETELDAAKTQLADANKALKVAKTEAETAGKALQGEQGYTQKLLVDNGLTAALVEAGVAPNMLKAVTALIRDAHKPGVKIDGENRAAVVGDKPLAEFVKEWSLSDEGKAFVTAPGNTGGGASGGGKGSAPNPFAKESFDLDAQGKLYTENPTQAKALAAAAGVTL